MEKPKYIVYFNDEWLAEFKDEADATKYRNEKIDQFAQNDYSKWIVEEMKRRNVKFAYEVPDKIADKFISEIQEKYKSEIKVIVSMNL